jgi:hypothetical protein
MKFAALFNRLAAAGVKLRFDGARLAYRARPGALTPELSAAMTAARDGLVEAYEERAAIMEHDGGLARDEAEASAAADVLGAAFAGIRKEATP